MLRFIAREVYTGHVVHAMGQAETRIVSFDGDQYGLEKFLTYADQHNEERPDYLSRELIGVEVIGATQRLRETVTTIKK